VLINSLPGQTKIKSNTLVEEWLANVDEEGDRAHERSLPYHILANTPRRNASIKVAFLDRVKAMFSVSDLVWTMLIQI
jgi:hypothetical protein